MPQADGTVLIDTEINADGMEAGTRDVEAAARRMAASVEDIGAKAKTSLNKQVDAFVKLNQEYAAQAKKVDELRQKVEAYGNQQIPTDEYRDIQAQIERAKQQMVRLTAAQERFIATGGKENSSTYRRRQYDIKELANTIKYAEGELKDLEETGKAFSLGADTKEAAADMERLASAERRLADMNNRLGTSYSSIKGQVNEYRESISEANKGQNKFNKSLKDTDKTARKSNLSLGRMLGTSILFSFAFQAISAVMGGIKEGFDNLSQYSSTTNNSLSMLMSSLTRLKNSLATAFAPILDIIAPILSGFIDMLSTAASYVSMFFAFLSGKSTYTRAVAVQEDYAASLSDTASAAQDAADATDAAAAAAEGYLSPLDQINKLNNSDISQAGGLEGRGTNSGDANGPLFEEVQIDNKFATMMDKVIDKLKQIKNILASGFWDGLGNYKPILKEIQKDFSSIGSYLEDIFTDKNVQTAASNFATALIYNIGKIAGSFALIGLTIAENIVGGIESYLSQNVGRVKKYLISMFEVYTEVTDILGNLAATVAEIFSEVFGSQIAQDLTGNIIGVFSTAFGAVTLLASSLGRDLLNFIAQPIIENKEAIKQALLETIEPLETVTQSIETFVQNLAASVMGLYTNHIKPFIDSITSGVSEIVGVILDGYNTYIAPILDGWAAKFDEVLNGPISDAFDSLIYLIVQVFDLLTILWNSVLVPLISWIIDNILPVISPIVKELGNISLDFFGTCSETVSGILDILGGLTEFLSGIFSGDWSKAFDGLGKVADGFRKSINTVFSFIQNNILEPFDNFLSNVFAVDWEYWFGILGIPLNVFFDNVKDIWESIKGVFNGVIQFINGVFSADWEEAWNGIKNIFKSVFTGLTNLAKRPINAIISAFNGVLSIVNGLINKINSIRFVIDVPDWIPGIGGASWGFNGFGIPSIGYIPYLAKGAVIPPNAPFMAVLGDQSNGKNLEMPENLLRKVIREESGKGSGNETIKIPVILDGRQIFEAVINRGKRAQSANGRNPFELA